MVPPPLVFDPLMPQAAPGVEGTRMASVNAAQAATWVAVSVQTALGSAFTNITHASLG